VRELSPCFTGGDPPGGQGAAGSNPASPTVFGLVRGKFGPGGGLWDRLEFHENFNGPLPEHTEPARSGPGSQLGGWDVGGQVNGQRVAEEGCRVSRCDPGPGARSGPASAGRFAASPRGPRPHGTAPRTGPSTPLAGGWPRTRQPTARRDIRRRSERTERRSPYGVAARECKSMRGLVTLRRRHRAWPRWIPTGHDALIRLRS
jgi:hypothetical protein